MNGLLLSESPPTTEAVKVGIPQLYVVNCGTMPLVLLTGEETNRTPLQVTVLIGLTSGVGFTNTVTVNIAPSQLPDFGVTLYVAVR